MATGGIAKSSMAMAGMAKGSVAMAGVAKGRVAMDSVATGGVATGGVTRVVWPGEMSFDAAGENFGLGKSGQEIWPRIVEQGEGS